MSANGGSPAQATVAAPARTAQDDTQKTKFKLVWPEQPDRAVLKRRLTPPPAIHVTCSKEERDNLFATVSLVGHCGSAEFALPNEVLENSKGDFRFKDEYKVTFSKFKFNFTSEQLHTVFRHLIPVESRKHKKVTVVLKFSLYRLNSDQTSQLLKEVYSDRNKPITIVSPGEYLDKKPELDIIIPKEGPYDSENDVVLLGSFPHMPSPYYVFFGDSCVSVSHKGKEFLQCRTPIHAPATVQVKVRCGHTETHDDIQYTFKEAGVPQEKEVSMSVSPATDKETREFAQLLSSVLTTSSSNVANVTPTAPPAVLPTFPSIASFDGNAGVDELVDTQAGFTRLFYSSFQGKEEAAAYLLNRNANVNRQDADGYTPLHWAVFGGHLNLVQMLLERGADMTIENCDGFTPVHIAACTGAVDLLKALLNFCHSHHSSCVQGQKSKNREPAAPCVDARNKLGETALHYAAGGGWHSAVEYLIREGGANLNIQNNDLETPLHWAARQGRKEACELLVKYGCAKDAEDSDHHRAVFYLQALAEYGPDGKKVAPQEMDWDFSVEKSGSPDVEMADGQSKPRRRSRQPKPKVFDDSIVEPLVATKRSRREKRDSTGINLSQQVADQLAAIKDRTKQPSVLAESLEMFNRIRPPNEKQDGQADDPLPPVPSTSNAATHNGYVNEQLLNLKINMQALEENTPYKNGSNSPGNNTVQVVIPTYPSSSGSSSNGSSNSIAEPGDQPLVGAPAPLHTNPAIATFLTQPKSHLQAHRNVKPIPTIELNDTLWNHISYHAVDVVGNMELVQVVASASGTPKELITIEQGFLHGNKVPVESRVIKFNHLKLNKKKPIDQIVVHKNVQDYFFQLKFTLPGYEPVYSCSFKIIAHISQMPGYVPMRPQNAHSSRTPNPPSPVAPPPPTPPTPTLPPHIGTSTMAAFNLLQCISLNSKSSPGKAAGSQLSSSTGALPIMQLQNNSNGVQPVVTPASPTPTFIQQITSVAPSTPSTGNNANATSPAAQAALLLSAQNLQNLNAPGLLDRLSSILVKQQPAPKFVTATTAPQTSSQLTLIRGAAVIPMTHITQPSSLPPTNLPKAP